jgi:hypothetical protein
MMEAEITSETSTNFYEATRRNIPEDSHLHTRRHQNLKSHQTFSFRLTIRNYPAHISEPSQLIQRRKLTE